MSQTDDNLSIIDQHNRDCWVGDSVTLPINGVHVITHTTSPARALPDGRPVVDIAYIKAPVDPRRLTILEPRQLTLAL
jgi:hypothetical protein